MRLVFICACEGVLRHVCVNVCIYSILDNLVPFKSFTCRLSSSKAHWFDNECSMAKRTS